MEYYKSFNAEAMELSKTLPEEQSELYKRHFVPMPLEEFAESIEAENGGLAEEEEIKAVLGHILENVGVKFDALIGPTRYIVINPQIKVVRLEDLTEEHMRGRLYSGREDRQVAFVHAHSKRFVYIDVPDGKSADLNILFVNTDVPVAAQVFVKTGNESRLNLLEWYASASKKKSMLGVLHEITVGKYAKAEVNMLHDENDRTYVLGLSRGRIKENAELRINYVYNGGLSTKVKNDIDAAGYAAKSGIVEMVLGSADQKFDINTVVSNTDAGTVSDLDSKAALMDSSACMLKGFADVGENAKGSLSFVNERGILLDKNAYMNSIPGMSINNANVKATHSSATAPIDAELMFYLMSRGMGEAAARRLLVMGFFARSIAKISNPIVKAMVASLVHEKINNRKFGIAPKLDMSDIWMEQTRHEDKDVDLFGGHYKYRNR